MTIRDVARRLPGILRLRDRSQALAMLDAILWPGLLESVLEVFRPYIEEPAFRLEGVALVTAPRQRRVSHGGSAIAGCQSQNELGSTTTEASSAAGLGSYKVEQAL